MCCHFCGYVCVNTNMSEKNDIVLSKTLSRILRHDAVKEGLRISGDGYVDLQHLLNHKGIKGRFTLADIKRVVATNNKQRFTIRNSLDNSIEICANQGHSLDCVPDLKLTVISETETTDVIHGTSYTNWNYIKVQGIRRMKRNHIHFSEGLPNNKAVVSGIRPSAEVFIYINLKLAILDGVKFFRSVNNVILSPGNEQGIIETKYFLLVHDRKGIHLEY